MTSFHRDGTGCSTISLGSEKVWRFPFAALTQEATLLSESHAKRQN